MEVSLGKLKNTLMAQVNRSSVVSNNLANQNTIGYKKDISFLDVLNEKSKSNQTLEVATNYDQGVMRKTDNPLDVALSGNGFFTVETDYGEAYTRDGHFRLDEQGVLKNSAGMPVLGEGGWIVLNSDFSKPHDISITESGEIFVDGEMADRLRISEFESTAELEKIGSNMFRATDRALEIESVNPMVHQGVLENSNVNPIEEMMSLIEIQRQFESSQKMVRGLDDIYRNAVSQVGRYR